MIVKRTHHFLHWAFGLFVAYLLLTRLLISWVQFFPASFISTVSAVSNTHIQAESIEVEQDWLGFQIAFTDLTIEAEDYQFQAEQLQADINTFSFFIPSVVYGDFLTIKRGAFQQKNVQMQNSSEEPFDIEQALRVEAEISSLWKRIRFEDLILSEVARPGLSFQFHEFQSIRGSRLTIVSEFSLSYKEALNYERFNFKSTMTPNVWGGVERGEFTLSSFNPLRVERLAKLLSLNWQQVLPRGELILDLTGHISQSRIASLELNLNSQALNWKQLHKGLPSSVGLQLTWGAEHQNIEKHIKDWRFSLSKIQIDNKYIDSVSPLEMYFEGGEYLRFSADYFDIEPFKVVVNSLIKNQRIAALFDRTAYLNISNLSGRLDWESLEVPELTIQFEKLDIPVTDFPGMSLQNLQILKTAESIQISSPKPIWVMSPSIHHIPMRIEIPKLVELHFDEINQAWSMADSQFYVDKMLFSMNINQFNPSYIDATFDMQIETMQKLKSYLPYPLMSEQLTKWLSESLQGGKNIKLAGEVRGLFEDFPFENGNGRLKLSAKVEGAKLKYNSKWPVLEKFDADIEFTPYKIDILIDELDVGSDVLAKNVLVSIPDVHKKDIALTMTGDIQTTLNDAVNYLTLSPIAQKLGMQEFFTGSTKFNGISKIKIDKIWVPISGYKELDERVSGRIEFKDAEIDLFTGAVFKKINGELVFNEEEVEAQRLTFNVVEGAGVANVKTDLKNKRVNINARGQAFKSQNDWFAKPLPWQAKLVIPFKSAKNRALKLDVTANLSEAESLLPEPLNQASLKSKTLNSVTRIEEGVIDSIIKVPGLVNTRLQWKDKNGKYQQTLTQLDFDLQKARESEQKSKLSFVKGQINKLNVDDWLLIASDFNLISTDDRASNLVWDTSTIKIENTTYLSRDYPSLNISWKSQKDIPLDIGIQNEDIQANVELVSASLVRVDVQKLNFITGESTDSVSLKSKEEAKSCPVKAEVKKPLPRIEFTGRDIYIHERKIESLQFVLKDSIERLEIEKMQGKFGNGAGSLDGSYIFVKSKNQSTMNLVLDSNNVSAVTKFLKINKGFTGKSAEVKLNVTWPGSLECFKTHQSTGDISFKLKEGAIEDVEPGFARLIGLLSVESLVRRLRLDLKDVTNKGMVYDEIKGSATLNASRLNLNEFKISAPSAKGNITGAVDITSQTFDLAAQITPKIGATVPTIAALAGSANPLAALAIYTVMKVIPGINENLVTYEYEVTGPWLDPIIKGKNQEKEQVNESEGSVEDEDILDYP